MRVELTVIKGPHLGAAFAFDDHASFVVGRHRRAQFRLALEDGYLSRFHFYVEIKPPECVLVDLKSINHTFVNGSKVDRVSLVDGDTIKAGKTTLRVAIEPGEPPTLPPPIEEEEGFLPEIPHYRLERLLGAGSCGAVYLASDDRDQARVALKILTPVIANCPKSIALFERETELHRKLDHPNIVALYEAGRADGRPFMAMEYVPGRDALHLVESSGGRLEIGRAVDMACQALRALTHAHEAGIVHRDIKPNNLLVARINGRDVVKVVDFGLARIYHDSSLSGLTVQGDVRGTLGFLAPEQIIDLRSVGPAADQYGVAATLYFLLTGERPYTFPGNVQDCLFMILQEDAIPIRRARPEIPDGLAAAIHRALSREPDDRYAGVSSMLEAIAPWADAG